MRKILNAFGLAAASVIGAANGAQAAVLDFNTGSCASTCGDGTQIDQGFGDIAGVLDVSYRSLSGAGASSVDYEFLYYWQGNYGDLQGVAWGGQNDAVGVAEITFSLLQSGQSISLDSLFTAGWPNVDRSTDFRVYDLGYNLVYSSGSVTAPGQGHLTISPNITVNDGLRLQWGPSGYNAGVDQVNFTIGGAVTGGVPEPSAWALLILGFGLMGAAMRRRRVHTAISFA